MTHYFPSPGHKSQTAEQRQAQVLAAHQKAEEEKAYIELSGANRDEDLSTRLGTLAGILAAQEILKQAPSLKKPNILQRIRNKISQTMGH